MSHPAARLLFWLIAIVALQYLDWAALGVFALVLGLSGQGVRRRWWVLVRRARFLLLTLWLILAYGTPGDVWRDLPWAPTEAGIYEATIHAVRLMVMLGSLGWLFESLPKERLMAGLWSLVQPLRRIRIDADRIVVRLALVFDYVEKAPPKGSWRHLLDESGHGEAGLDKVRIELPAWGLIDTLSLVGLGVVMAAGVWLA
ncbi:MAG TPA: hypothetical protein VFF03_13465 [Rhodocyclaceae bacterium]|nr:hypothetical protein [Rhodocyclaceae bacterium]